MTDDGKHQPAEKIILALAYHLRDHGPVVLVHSGDTFSASSQWGEEAPDSPMAGAAAYGMNEDLTECLIGFLNECRHL